MQGNTTLQTFSNLSIRCKIGQSPETLPLGEGSVLLSRRFAGSPKDVRIGETKLPQCIYVDSSTHLSRL
jgi:hypothetical protein